MTYEEYTDVAGLLIEARESLKKYLQVRPETDVAKPKKA